MTTGDKRRVFYHISDVDTGASLREKDEVEFQLIPDKMRKGDMKAANIKLIGRVTIDTEEKKEPEIPQFMPAWMKMSKAKETPTDTAADSYKPKKQTAEQLIQGLEGLPREKGTVTTVRDKFGFIKVIYKNSMGFKFSSVMEEPSWCFIISMKWKDIFSFKKEMKLNLFLFQMIERKIRNLKLLVFVI
jgi:hypothetical protein